MHKRYSIFVSSVATALPYTKRVAIDCILSLGHFPVEMGYFPASNQDNFEFICNQIDSCDYMVILLGGMYGSGFVEREYDYALKKKIPVIAFVHEDPSALAETQRETTKLKQKKLKRFIGSLKKHAYATYTGKVTLSRKLSSSLQAIIGREEQRGWIRDIIGPHGQLNDIPSSIQRLYTWKMIREVCPMQLYDHRGTVIIRDIGFDYFVRAVLWLLDNEDEDVLNEMRETFRARLPESGPRTAEYIYTRLYQMVHEMPPPDPDLTLKWPISDFLNKISMMRGLGLIGGNREWPYSVWKNITKDDWADSLFDEALIDETMSRSVCRPVPELGVNERQHLEWQPD